jgi:uncharacterized protein YcnI
MKIISMFSVAAVLAAMPFHVALAHITANPSEAPADGYFRTALRVGHGCEGSPTTAVRVKLPDGLLSVRPQQKPGWKIEIKMRKLAQPVDAGHGKMVSETVDEIIWRGGNLPDAYFDEFGISMKLPARPKTTLYFPTVQECAKGVSRWIEIPEGDKKWGDYKSPAPFIKLLEPKSGH